MAVSNQSPARIAFGPFELDPSTGELRKSGVPVRLSGQPFQILLILLAHPGEVVAREQLRAAVWGDGTFVDFEHSLNAVVNKLRRALGDSADESALHRNRAGARISLHWNSGEPPRSCPPRQPFPRSCPRDARSSLVVACGDCRCCCALVSCGIAFPSLHDDVARLEAYPAYKRCGTHGLTSPVARWQTGGLLLRLKLHRRAGSLYQTGCWRAADPFDLRWRRQHDAGFFAGREHNCLSIKPGWRRYLRDTGVWR